MVTLPRTCPKCQAKLFHYGACPTCTPETKPLPSQAYLKEWDERIVRLQKALDESVKLQSHYASLLNQYDSGKRLQFKNGQEWIERLDSLAHTEQP